MVVEVMRSGNGGRVRECERGVFVRRMKRKERCKSPLVDWQIRRDICECVVCGGEIRGRWVTCNSLKKSNPFFFLNSGLGHYNYFGVCV